MEKQIKLLKNNDERDLKDIEWIKEFYEFLQGEIPSGMNIQRGHKPKMSGKKAFSIIWYLQEHLPLFPDNIVRCGNCGDLYDSGCEGIYWESKGKHYCGCCEDLVPYNYDNNMRE
ncbi:MAG: hypothetical protein ACTSYW_00635 [Candidatus Heimdallarchaeota archaeon]